MEGSPIKATTVAAAATAGLPGTPGASPVWSALAPAAAKPSDFASDLAHLMALLTQGDSELPDSDLPPLAERALPERSDTSADAVSSLWAELGWALPGEIPTQPPVTGNPPVVAPETAAATSARPTGLVDLTALPATNLPPAAGAVSAAAGAAIGIAADAPAADPAVPAAAASGPVPSDDASPPPTIQNLASLAALAPAEPIRHAPLATAPATVVDVAQPQAPQQIAETVAWHVGKGVSEVRIRLNPEDLGPLDIQIKLDGDKVNVRFDMADSSVRDVVQTSLPSLSSLLSARGLQLDQAQVFSQGRGHGTPPHPQHAPSSFSSSSADTGAENPIATAVRAFVRRGLLDDYA